MSRPSPRGFYVGTCPDCGKRQYASKHDARQAAKDLGDPMSAYPCGEYWHMGHLPQPVKDGVLDRRNIGIPSPRRAPVITLPPAQPPWAAKPPLITLRLWITCPSCGLHFLVDPWTTARLVLGAHLPKCTPAHALSRAA